MRLQIHRSCRLVSRGFFGHQFGMPSAANVTILPSQFPGQVRRDLLESLRARKTNHKFHYDSIKQTQKWLALHDAYAPSRNDDDCRAIYEAGFAAATQRVGGTAVHLIGLGCGGGQKDAQMLSLLGKLGLKAVYTPSDVSVAMVLVARETALAAAPGMNCHPVVCDLATEEALAETLAAQTPPGAIRLITFFGMIPNFEPDLILPRLAGLLQTGELLLFSGNLAPGSDYAAGVKKILPLYDNAMTRDWLLTFLFDRGVDPEDGALKFGIEDGQAGMKRVVADFHFHRGRRIGIGAETIEFHAGEPVRLFFSYRHTPELAARLLGDHGIKVLDQWITKSGEEGVFLCQKTA